MNSKNQRISLAWGIVTIFCVVLGLGLLVPVYADEAANVFMRGSFLANGARLNLLLPQCSLDFLHAVPWSHYPGALVSDLIYSAESPLGVRIRGMAISFAWLGLTAGIIRTLIQPRAVSAWAVAGFCAILGVGVLPLTLVMMRGEQMLLLLLSVFIGFPLLMGRFNWIGKRGTVALLAILFCVVVSTFLYSHPKALFFLPLVLLSAVASFWPRSKALCALVSVFVLICAWDTLKFVSLTIQCPQAPMLSAALASNTISLREAFVEPRAFLFEILANIWTAPNAMLKHIAFADSYQSSWLAPFPGTTDWWPLVLLNRYISVVIRAVYWIALILPLFLIAFHLMRRQASHALLWAGATWLVLLAHSALFKTWNFYAPSLAISLAAWCLVFCLATILTHQEIAHHICEFPVGSALVLPMWAPFLASAAVLAFYILPHTMDAIFSSETGLPRQPLSVPVFNYTIQREKIREFAQQCHVDGDDSRHLVVDNLTYFAFRNLREPLHSDYLSEQSFGVDLRGDALPQLLKRLGVPAILAQCTMFPAAFSSRVHRTGNLCCVNINP